MHPKALAIFYSLSIFVLGTALFVLQPNAKPEVANLQNSMKQQFSIAWQQTMGDQPYFAPLTDLYDGIGEFFNQTTESTIALLAAPDSDRDIAFVLQAVYSDFSGVFDHSSPTSSVAQEVTLPPGKFMSESPLYNIVPATTAAATPVVSGNVSGVSVEPVNAPNSWVTIRDNFTGQLYCLAVYNGEVNKYLGACRNDYH